MAENIEPSLLSFLEKGGFSKYDMELEIIPVLKSLQITNEILLRTFCWSEKVRQRAREAGMSTTTIRKICVLGRTSALIDGDFRVISSTEYRRFALLQFAFIIVRVSQQNLFMSDFSLRHSYSFLHLLPHSLSERRFRQA